LKRTKQEGEFYDLYREINETSNYINAVRRGVFSPSPERAKELAEKTPQIKETKRKFKLYRDKLKNS